VAEPEVMGAELVAEPEPEPSSGRSSSPAAGAVVLLPAAGRDGRGEHLAGAVEACGYAGHSFVTSVVELRLRRTAVWSLAMTGATQVGQSPLPATFALRAHLLSRRSHI